MKLKCLLLAAGVALLGTTASAQIVTDGDFETGSDSSWTVWNNYGTFNATFDYSGDGPAGGSGSSLRYEISPDSEGGVFQQITLTGGNEYEFDGLLKEVVGTFESSWMEVWVGPNMPTNGVNYNGSVGATMVVKTSTWVCDDYEGSFVSGCETPSGATLTAAGVGAQTYYLMIKSGVCCGGAAAEYVFDDVVVNDLGVSGGPTFDEPPTPFNENFDDGDDQNNYGGGYVAFAGGDPGATFTNQDANVEAVSEDGEGFTSMAGDFGLHAHATAPLSGDTFVYFGFIVQLSETEMIGRDLGSSFDQLQFDIRMGDLAASTNWAVRLEDTFADNNTAGNYNYIDLEPTLLSTGLSWTTVTIPLDDFVNNADGGTTAPDLSIIDVITFVSKDVADLDTDIDIYIDNISITNSATSAKGWELY